MKFKICSLFTLFYVFIPVTTQQDTADLPREEAKLTINPTDDLPIVVQLKRTESFLANENLPIWKIESNDLSDMNHLHVMQKLGSFAMYHDSETSSAAVYFHKRHEFDGIINVRFIIKDLSIPKDIDEQPSDIRNPGVIERLKWGHDEVSLKTKERYPFKIVHVSKEWIGEEVKTNMISSELKLRDLYPDNFYIETLVIINYDMAQELLGENGDDYNALVSHILVILNGAVMLLRKFDTPKIRVNIAGIIILHNQMSMEIPSECFIQTEILWSVMKQLNSECIMKFIEEFIQTKREKIHADSYDVILFLTRYLLLSSFVDEESKKEKLVKALGVTTHPTNGIHEYKKYNRDARISIVAEDAHYYANYPVLAHEYVHSIGVFEHDVNPTNTQKGICRSHLMREGEEFCEQCLNWSPRTKSIVERIFRTPDSCIFKNEPQSLFPPGPRLMLTAEEQCQCYGYDSAVKYQGDGFLTSCLKRIPNLRSDYCNKYLLCKNEGEPSVVVELLPMDGTPCSKRPNSNKVCWNRKCTKILNKISGRTKQKVHEIELDSIEMN